MKKLIQIRISQREMKSSSIDDAILIAIQSHLRENIQLKWSATKIYLLLFAAKQIYAIDFGHQWTTLRNQLVRGARLKCYLSLEEKFIKIKKV